MTTLCDLKPGQYATIERFLDEAVSIFRLKEMGLLPGTVVQLMRKAPWGGPLQIKVRGSVLSLRRSEALFMAISLA
jgi:ferrous iron transport protein A